MTLVVSSQPNKIFKIFSSKLHKIRARPFQNPILRFSNSKCWALYQPQACVQIKRGSPLLTRVAVAWLGSQNGLCAVFIRASRSDHLLASSCIVPMLMLLDQTARLDQGTDGVLPSTPTQVCLYTAHINQSRTNNWRLHCITFHVLARQSTANSSQIHQTLIGQADPNRGPASSHVKQRN